MNRSRLAWIDALVFSSVWLAAGAGVLVVAASRAMGIGANPLAVGLATCGTLVVYNVDRLRDVDRDRRTSPERSAFVSRHRAALVSLAVVAAALSAGFAARAGTRAAIALAPVLVVGLLHRRLKQFAAIKSAYITLAWMCVVVGLPVVLDPGAGRVGWVAAILGASVAANAIASNLRDLEAAVARFGEVVALRSARAFAALSLLLCALGPVRVAPLAAVPLLTLCGLTWFRRTERFGLIFIDGALLAGGLAAIAI